MSDYISHKTIGIITYLFPDLRRTMLVKRVLACQQKKQHHTIYLSNIAHYIFLCEEAPLLFSHNTKPELILLWDFSLVLRQGLPFLKIFTCPAGKTDGTFICLNSGLTCPNTFLMTMNQIVLIVFPFHPTPNYLVNAYLYDCCCIYTEFACTIIQRL